MGLILLSFLGGVLTILSPCVLPLLPIIIGGSLTDKHKWRPVVITASLSFSLVLFTLALKWSTAFIEIPPRTWAYISGGLVIALGVVTVFPKLWEHLANALKLSNRSNKLLAESGQKKGMLGAVLVGLSLGPVFSSCSPTYALILATVLPASFAVGLVNLIAYAVGLAVVLLLIAVFGQKLIEKLKWAANPDGMFKKVLGALFILVGVLIILGVDKQIETALVERGFGITALEERLVTDISTDVETEMEERMEKKTENAVSGNGSGNGESVELNVKNPVSAPELIGLTDWINSEPLTLEELDGKVVLIDFWTYSCINCVRTLPFLRDWHEKYTDDGLVIIGVHAPEFAFERVPANVQEAVDEHTLEYPIALDNDFATWRAYSNKYWPAKYFIDREGKVRHTHFGEGEYEESEAVIRYLLEEGGSTDDEIADLGTANTPPISRLQTPETYLGYERANTFIGNGGLQEDVIETYDSASLNTHYWTLDGEWEVTQEASVSHSDESALELQFAGKSVYLVMSAEEEKQVRVLLNGEPISAEQAGVDVVDGVVTVNQDDIYHLVELESVELQNSLRLETEADVSMYAFTFGS